MDSFNIPKSRLTYALNNVGQLVYIEVVQTGINCNCFCPACKEPLVAKNQGGKRIHHFAHKSGTECAHAVESMLHILAKEKIQESFLSKSEFYIEFCYKSYCINIDSCKFIRLNNGECCDDKVKRYDLKKFYDSCEQEISYDNVNRRSDLKIYSSIKPNLPPIYIEFYVTHACDFEKLHSGNKIIEIKIDKEEDILSILNNGIKESNNNVCFYGFNNKDKENKTINREINFFRYQYYKSGKSNCKFYDCCSCNKITKKHASSLLEMVVHTVDSYHVCNYAKYYAFKEYGIKNCTLCVNYVESYRGVGKICRLYKRLELSYWDEIDTERAKECRCFKINQQEMETILSKGLNEEYIIFK